jgi:lactate racemase
MKRVTIEIPFGNRRARADVSPERILFDGKMKTHAPLEDFETILLQKLDNPIGAPPLKQQVRPDDRVLILIDDNTRSTPVHRILPVLIDYLLDCGVPAERIEIMTAPGTHRKMTRKELEEKVGPAVYGAFVIHQHDFCDEASMANMGSFVLGGVQVPIMVNKKALEADFLIGLGSIVPHCDAGFSGGGKIVQPGICGKATTAATHLLGALLPDIPLGVLDANPCRQGIDMVAGKVGLAFIVNVVMAPEGGVVGIFAGDFLQAHRAGCKMSLAVHGVPIPRRADIVIVSAAPGDIDYWQAQKGLVAAYFAVKPGGVIILVARCDEGLEHNHPQLRQWVKMSYAQARELAGRIPLDSDQDLVAADIAMGHCRARERADIYILTDGLTSAEIALLGYVSFETLQAAVDAALSKIPDATIGILPRGADCFPYNEACAMEGLK